MRQYIQLFFFHNWETFFFVLINFSLATNNNSANFFLTNKIKKYFEKKQKSNFDNKYYNITN